MEKVWHDRSLQIAKYMDLITENLLNAARKPDTGVGSLVLR